MKIQPKYISGYLLMAMLISVFMTGSVIAGGKKEMNSSATNSGNNMQILNGMDFRGKMSTYGDIKSEDEEIIFENGMFHSVLCDKYEFQPSKYTIRQGSDKNIILFYTEAANSNGDKMLWHGSIKLDHTGLTKRHKIEAYATLVPVNGESALFLMNGEASQQSMKHSSDNTKKTMQTASKEDN